MNTLFILTGFRVYATYRPFKTNSLKFALLPCCLLLSWIISIVMAVLPLLMKTAFVQKILIEPNLFFKFRLVKLSDIQTYINKTLSLQYITNASTVKSNITTHDIYSNWYFNNYVNTNYNFSDRNVLVKGTLGFYSSSPVCFPDYYSQTSPSKEYSIILICNNFLI